MKFKRNKKQQPPSELIPALIAPTHDEKVDWNYANMLILALAYTGGTPYDFTQDIKINTNIDNIYIIATILSNLVVSINANILFTHTALDTDVPVILSVITWPAPTLASKEPEVFDIIDNTKFRFTQNGRFKLEANGTFSNENPVDDATIIVELIDEHNNILAADTEFIDKAIDGQNPTTDDGVFVLEVDITDIDPEAPVPITERNLQVRWVASHLGINWGIAKTTAGYQTDGQNLTPDPILPPLVYKETNLWTGAIKDTNETTTNFPESVFNFDVIRFRLGDDFDGFIFVDVPTSKITISESKYFKFNNNYNLTTHNFIKGSFNTATTFKIIQVLNVSSFTIFEITGIKYNV